MSFPDRPVAQLLGSNGPVHAVTYSAGSGTYILTGSSDRSIRLYNPLPTTGTAGTPSLAKTKDHGFVTSSSAGATPRATPIPEGRLIQTYAEHGYEVLSLACAADNARFVSSGGDRTVFLWDVTTAQTLRRFGGGTGGGRVNCVCFAGEGDSLVVSGGFDTVVRVWDTRSGGSGPNVKPIQALSEARDAISALVVRGAQIVAASVDGRVRTYDVRTGRQTTDVISGSAGVTSLSLTRDGRSLLVGALDSRLRLLDRENGTCLRTYSSGSEDKESATAKDAGLVWRNEELRVQSLIGGRERFVVAGDEMGRPPGEAAALTPSKNTTPDGRVWAWDLLTGRVAATVTVPWGPPGAATSGRSIGRDGREKERRNVTSCLAWQDGGWGDQFCVGGTSGVVTVFGPW
ncbi:mitogen-activated protein kinase organizer 1 [Sporothrix brasiliensis 5110]|uniref:Mitogen-activated protein kinase organizer 1 n=1 Tax=Sporothrix brasiliensis 5110 TaxID=1398154 RepID=A0A0C2FBD3_9PEZI|nr:mitogen-activated protein kinase organizer 1 [Sporothrix brasiliensis 5110]KIH88398.1 mitogen-activated protein kinase organizer 1 [Sporothrix brasiliensis 5110]